MKSKHLSMQGMISLLMVIVGNFIYALAVKLFLIPGGLITGGTTGIALAVNYLSGFSVSTFVLIFKEKRQFSIFFPQTFYVMINAVYILSKILPKEKPFGIPNVEKGRNHPCFVS